MRCDREVVLTLSDEQYDELGRAIVALRERFELDTSALVVRAVVQFAAVQPAEQETAHAKA
jgi:hypothetical protein